MPIEVELKARVADREGLLAVLERRAGVEASVYHDTYYDWPDGSLDRGGRRELRVRVVERAGGRRAVLTYKDRQLDDVSSPEYETTVGDAAAVDTILRHLGLEPVVAYQKYCRNFVFRDHGHDITATVVEVPELDGETFVEIETLVDHVEDTPQAKEAIRRVGRDVGLRDDDLTDELYTDRVKQHRSTR